MNRSSSNSMRVMFDLQACQTEGSAHRGVGNYSQALFSSIASICPPRELYALVSEQLPFSANIDCINRARVLSAPQLPSWNSERDFEGGEQDTLDAILYSAALQTMKPDIVHVSHAFEGFLDRVALPHPSQRTAGQILSATLYDLIPLRFQEHYFRNKRFERWYKARLAWLRQADLLLAISETSKRDAIELLGIDCRRIVTIHGGVADHFQPSFDRASVRHKLKQRYPLRERLLLYTGGDDYRKNIQGAIEGFAQLPQSIRKDTSLFIVCSMQPNRKEKYLDIAHAAGLTPDDVYFTGFVSNEDLIAFYGICDAFIFPSLYEGLGLPVLEAMACGAPVLGANNSSIRELIVREDALFDPSSAESIGTSITKLLTDSDFAQDLREYSLKRSEDFSWEKSANLALEAFDEVLARTRTQGVQCAKSGWLPRKRLAVLSPLPPCRSGIADYNARFLPFLARHFDIDLYVNGYKVKDNTLSSAFRIFDAKDFEPVATSYDVILYEMGNSEFHAHMLPLLQRYPGVIVLHDAYLSGFLSYFDFHLGQSGFYSLAMLAAHGPLARRYLAPIQACPDAIDRSMVELPGTKNVLDHAIGVISHSPFSLAIARQYYPEGWLAPYRTISQMVIRPQLLTSIQRLQLRERLQFKPDDFIIITLGHVAWIKWGDRLLEAFLQSLLCKESNVYLIYVGELTKDKFGAQLSASIKKANLGKRIRITGYLSDLEYENFLQVADLGVQLRTKSRGSTSKGVLDCLAFGVPVIVNNDVNFIDYPSDIVIKLAAEPTATDIAQKLEDLFQSREQLAAYRAAGLRYVANFHDPEQCAAEYAAAIHEFAERQALLKSKSWVPAFAPHLSTTGHPQQAAQTAASLLTRLPVPRFNRLCLYIDVSYITQSDHKTEIPGVVKEMIHAFYCMSRAGIEPVAVELHEGELFVAQNWLAEQGLLLPEELKTAKQAVIFQPDDILLMSDSSWIRYQEFYRLFERAHQANVSVITAIYDILPILSPQDNFVEGGKKGLESWFCEALLSSDGLVCISKTVADDVLTYFKQSDLQGRLKKIGYWHLGSDLNHHQTPLKTNHEISKPDTCEIQGLTWEESIESLLKVIVDQSWYWKKKTNGLCA